MIKFEYLVASLTSYQFWVPASLSFFLLWKLMSRRYNLPPRPHSWPVIGNVYHVFKGDPFLYKWCRDVAKEVGPVIRISLGPVDAIVLNDLDSTQKAMQQKGGDFDGRMKSYLTEVFSDGYNDVAMADPDDPTFKSRRKLLATALRNFSVGRSYEKRMAESLSKVFKLLDALSRKHKEFDPENYCKLFTYNFMASMCFQKGYDLDDPEFIELSSSFQEANDAFSSGVTLSDLPLVRYLPFDLWDIKKVRKLMNKFTSILNREIELSRKRGEQSDEIGDLTLYVLRTREEGAKEGLDQVTDVQIEQLIGDVFGAGVDTSQMTLRWLLLCLAIHQDVQEKVYQEILDNVKDGDDLMVSAIDYKTKMPYSEAVLLETTRYGTVAPFGLPHTTMRDTEMDDYDVPKGTLVMVNQWAINHDERNFEEPDKFKPERFLDDEGKIGPRPKGYMPFGLGRRSCPGETSAKISVWITYVSLLKRYKILPPEGVLLKAEYKQSAFEGTPVPYRIVLSRR